MDKAQPSELVEWLRSVAPRQKEGRANGFAFNMDGLCLQELNAKINEAADFIEERLTPTPEPCRVREALVEARFLCERLREFSWAVDANNAEDIYRDFHGHVAPSLARLESALSASPAEPEEATEAMIEAGALALCRAYDRQKIADGGVGGALVAYQAGVEMTIEFWNGMAFDCFAVMHSAAPIEKREE